MQIIYRPLRAEEIDRSLLDAFDRRQRVDLCYRRAADGSWCIRSDRFLDDWSEEDKAALVCSLRALAAEGAVFGAFEGGALKGFCALSARPFGRDGEYRDLCELHVSRELRGRGIGKALFMRAAEAARRFGGKKLYISAQSAVETQAFYRALGCKDAAECSLEHIKKEPFDCQLEYIL